MVMPFRSARNLAFSVMLFMIIGVSVYAYLIMERNAERVDEIVVVQESRLNNWYELSEVIREIESAFNRYQTGESEVISPVMLLLDKALRKVNEMKASGIYVGELRNLDSLADEMLTFRQVAFLYATEVKTGYKYGASGKEMKRIAQNALIRMNELSNSTLHYVTDKIAKKKEDLLGNIDESQRVLAVVLFVSIVVTAGAAIFMSRALARPIFELVTAAKRIAAGDLDGKIEVETDDEIGELKEAFNHMVEEVQCSQDAIEIEKNYVDSILSSMNDTLVVVNADGVIMTVNQALLNLLGYAEEELVGRPIGSIFAAALDERGANSQTENPGKTGDWQKSILNAISSTKCFNWEVTYRTKDGRNINMLFNSSAMKNSDGEVISTACTAQNITLLKKMEADLDKINKCFLNFGPDPGENIQLVVNAVGSIFGGKCVFYNKLDGEVLRTEAGWNIPEGFAKESPKEGHICVDVIAADLNEPYVVKDLDESKYAELDPAIARYGLKTYLAYVVRENDIPVGSLCVVYDEDRDFDDDEKKVLTILSQAVGVEEERKKEGNKVKEAYAKLKEAQEQVIQGEKLKAIGQLASGVAHEVKNPLGIVLQGVNYLEGKLELSEDDSEILDMMVKNIKRADNIIGTLVEYSRATKVTLKAEDINDIIKVSLVLVRHRVNLKNIEIVEDLDKNLPSVAGDKGKMEQVFVNLFLNAIQAMPDGGKLFIRSCQKKLDAPGDGVGRRDTDTFDLGEEAVIVEIEDTGASISEDNLQKIFDPFFSTKGPKDGTGMGLSVTKNIIDLHRGFIGIENRIDGGVKVSLTLKIHSGG